MTNLPLILETAGIITFMLAFGNIFFLAPMYIKFKKSIVFKFTIFMMILVDYVSIVLVIISLLLFDNSELFLSLSVVLYGFGIILSLILVLLIQKTILLPLDTALSTSKKLGEGDLKDIDIDLSKRSDEIGILINSSYKMLSFLKPILTSTEELTTKLKSTAYDLASSSEEVNASSEELSSIAQQTAKLAQEQTKQVDNSTRLLKNLNQSFHEKIQGIQTTSTNITSIQEQINILSLNASIEAVRAGDYGRGFAVVAQNIKNLSEETKISMDAIEENIRDLTITLTNAIENLMDNFYILSTSAVEYSSQSEEAGAATEQQSASIEEITSTAQELSDLSDQLDKLSKKFKL